MSTVKLREGSLTALLERQSTDLRSTDECQWEAERRGASVIGQSGDLNVTLVSDQLQPPTFARSAGFVCNQRGHVLSAPENIANAGKKYFTDQQMVVFVSFCPAYCILDMQRCHARGVTQRRFCCEPSFCFYFYFQDSHFKVFMASWLEKKWHALLLSKKEKSSNMEKYQLNVKINKNVY